MIDTELIIFFVIGGLVCFLFGFFIGRICTPEEETDRQLDELRRAMDDGD